MSGVNCLIILGNIIHSIKPFSVHSLEKGFVIVHGPEIIAVDYASALDETKTRLNISDDATYIILKDSQFLIPGLIDTHIHAPQYPNAGVGYDKSLLDWLKTYTYPVEKKFADAEFAKIVYNAMVRKTLDFGTTTASYFGSLYQNTTLELVDAAISKGQRAFVGKVNMIQFSFYNYVETPEESIRDTRLFVEAVLSKKSDLVKPVITPRFALSVDLDLMKQLAAIAREYDLNIQSHIAENLDEISLVEEQYRTSYADAYDRGQLLTNKTVLAHGIYLQEEEMRLLAKRGTSISHCPLSNTLLKSGMCDVKKLTHYGITVGLGTDVSGGASCSMINAMRSAIHTSIHLSLGKKNYDPLNGYDAFYLATLGGAKALAIDDKVGNFEVGKEFDALVVDMDVENSPVDYFYHVSAMDLLGKFIFLGDDRNVVKVFVAGKLVKSI